MFKDANFRFPLDLALCLGVFFAFPASAQDEREGDAVLEEVIVTATKRGAVAAQDVAYNVSVVNGEFLDELGADDFYGFARRTGIQAEDEGPGEKRFIIRGVNLAGSTSVGLYYDDIATSGWGQAGNGDGQPEFRVLDLERIEILRGPQGTLYGAGSVGGTVRFVTNKPNMREFEGSLSADFAGVGQGGGTNYAFDGVIDIPLVEDRLGLRAVGFWVDRDGITDNLFLGIDGANYQEIDGGRAILRWQPMDELIITSSYWRQNTEVGDRPEWNPLCNPAVHVCYLDPAVGTEPSDSTAITRSSNGRRISTQGTVTPYVGDLEIYSFDVLHEFSFGTLTSTTSWFIRDVNAAFESSDFSAGQFFSPDSVLPVGTAQDTEQFNKELLFSSRFGGPVNFVAGLFYQRRDSLFRQRAAVVAPLPGRTGLELLYDEVQPQESFVNTLWFLENIVGVPGVLANLGSGVIFDTQFEQEFSNLAVFGEVNWQVTERLALDFGLRWFDLDNDIEETKLLKPDFSNLLLGVPLAEANQSSSFSDTIFKVTASFDFNEDVLGYATWSEGFREGGVNPLRTAEFLPIGFEPDRATNYEAGLKMDLLDRQLTVNTAFYFVEIENLQVFVPDPTGLFNLFLNLEDGGAEIKGFELEATYAPFSIPGLQAQFGAQWTDAEYTADIPGLNPDGSIGMGDPERDGRKGDPLEQVGDWTLSGNLHYRFPAFDRQAFVMLDWSYTGEAFSDDNPRSPFGSEVGGYHLVGLRLGLSGEDWGGWAATLYANNLFNEDGLITYEDRKEFFPNLRPNSPTLITTYPRTIGLNLSKTF